MSDLVLAALTLAALILVLALVTNRLHAVRATSRQYRCAVCAAGFDTLGALQAHEDHARHDCLCPTRTFHHPSCPTRTHRSAAE